MRATFILNEVKDLAKLGFNIIVYTLSPIPPNESVIKSNNSRITVVAPSINNYFAIIISHFYYFFYNPLKYISYLFDLKNRGGKKVFIWGVWYSRKVSKANIKHIHAHWATDSTHLAKFISEYTGIPYSFTCHARDIYIEADHFEEKLRQSKFVITCVNYNKQLIVDRYGEELKDKIHVVYHGVDIFKFIKTAQGIQSGIDVLSVGRLVEKKGFEYLIKAISLINKKDLNMKCIIVGDGEEYNKLENLISKLGLNDVIKLIGLVRNHDLLKFYSSSKIFILPCVITKYGDRDGIPNVLAEAMAMSLPVISTQLPNISELIENEKDGMLVPEKEPKALANAIEKLLGDEKLRKELGKNARDKIVKQFDSKRHIKDLASIFRLMTE